MSTISEKLRLAREKSKKRKELLGCTLGSSWAEELGGNQTKITKVDKEDTASVEIKRDESEPDPTSAKIKSSKARTESTSNDDGNSSSNRTEEFRDSTAFLKGTQSLNPHNDYSQNFVDTGHRPQNFIRKFYEFTV